MAQGAPRICQRPGCGRPLLPGQRCEAHPLAGSFADARRGSRQARGYGASWDRLRPLILARDGGLCQACRRAGILTPGCNIVDHILNKANGGTDAPENLETICAPCHKEKTQREAGGSDQAPPGRVRVVGRVRLL